MSINITDDILNSNFPLFDLLYEKVKNKTSIQDNEIIELAENIRKLYSKSANVYNVQHIIFVLVRIYSLRNENLGGKKNIFDIPYSGTKLDSSSKDENNFNIKFVIINFPPKLKNILLEYTRLELNKSE